MDSIADIEVTHNLKNSHPSHFNMNRAILFETIPRPVFNPESKRSRS